MCLFTIWLQQDIKAKHEKIRARPMSPGTLQRMEEARYAFCSKDALVVESNLKMTYILLVFNQIK